MRLGHKSRLAIAALLAAFAVFAGAAPAANAAPTCAEGPQIEGDTFVGTPCADTIRAPRGVTDIYGNGGNDTLYGQRGNDSLYGGDGSDRLYGGIGDDRLRGGPGDDRLSGGFGADTLNGEGGSDFARGDATIDAITDSGEDGATDTLSYSTGATPGFPNQGSFFDYEGFPGDEGGRGVYIDLEDLAAEDGNGFANDGRAPAGGGVDLDLDGESFERVIGTPFPDFIVGSGGAEAIYGGGGADVILGEGGADQLHGGAEGDSCDGDPGSTVDCERSDKEVEPRSANAIAVGLMTPPGAGPPALYLTGSDEGDAVAASYTDAPAGEEDTVTFTLGAGSDGSFDTSPSAAGGCGTPAGGKVICTVAEAPDSILLAGLGGDDTLAAAGFPEATSVILLGGDGDDDLTGGTTEDALVDGPGDDSASAAGGDDAVPNNDGADDLDAGPGEDLFVSDAICDGDVLDGGPDRDNANWANFDQPVVIDMGAGVAGLVGTGGQPSCPSTALLTNLGAIEDIEGTSLDDTLIGDAGPNQLLGRPGHDTYFAAAGDDSILANSGDADVTIDCGEGFDTAQVDHPQYGDPTPVDCESVYERDPDSFRPPDTPPNPNPLPESPLTESPPASAKTKPQRLRSDHTPPRTRILRRPPKRVLTSTRAHRVVFAFASNEAGSRFRCKLDRDRFRPCRSPRAYRLHPGHHALRVFAIDTAGNRDPAPALFRFTVRRVSVR